MSDKCPDPMPISDGTVCSDEGQCKRGSCISYCQVMSPAFAPCICENSNSILLSNCLILLFDV